MNSLSNLKSSDSFLLYIQVKILYPSNFVFENNIFSQIVLNLNTEIMAKEENISKIVSTFSIKTVDMESSVAKMKS